MDNLAKIKELIKELIKEFYPVAKEQFGFHKPVRLFLRQDACNGANPLGKTAYYDPGKMAITLYITGRHPKDVLRSFSHELVHHKQNCEGCFDKIGGEMERGYAQKNKELRKLEAEAYLKGNLALRDWEDSKK